MNPCSCRPRGTLVSLGDVRALETLITPLEHQAPAARQEAAQMLGELGEAQLEEPLMTAVVEPLIVALGDEDSGVRASAAQALGMLGDVRAVEPLVAALKDKDGWWVRPTAAKALGKIAALTGDEQAVEALIAALKGMNRPAATDALKDLSGQDFGADADAWQAWWRKQR
jgi:HEAT repeat protein